MNACPQQAGLNEGMLEGLMFKLGVSRQLTILQN